MPKKSSATACPECGGRPYVMDSRASGLAGVIRRRRYKCLACGHMFSTHESIPGELGDRSKEINRLHRDMMNAISAVVQEYREKLMELDDEHMGEESEGDVGETSPE